MTTLAALRFLAGIGLGGALPNAATLAAEFVPPAQRPMAVTATIVCVPLGGMLAGILGSQLLDADRLARALRRWRRRPSRRRRGADAPVAGIAAFLARHPAMAGARAVAEARPSTARVRDSRSSRRRRSVALRVEFRRDTIALWFSFCSCLLAVYLGFSWLPTVLAGAGFDPGVASNGITAFNLGGVVGALASGAVMSRIGSRAAMLTMNVGAIAGALTLSLMTISIEAPLAPIMIMLTITGGLINAIQTTMYALATNVYPSAVRASGVGAATAVGRTGAIISGYAGPWALGVSRQRLVLRADRRRDGRVLRGAGQREAARGQVRGPRVESRTGARMNRSEASCWSHRRQSARCSWRRAQQLAGSAGARRPRSALMQAPPKPLIANAKPVRSCESLASVALPNTTIESAAVDANNPDICRVVAITTHPPAGDKVRIWIAIPTSNWNGRFLGTGGGGFSGGSRERRQSTGGAGICRRCDRHGTHRRQRVLRARRQRQAGLAGDPQLRARRHPRDDRHRQGADAGDVRRGAALFVLQRVFDGRTSGPDGGAAISAGLRRHRVGGAGDQLDEPADAVASGARC